MIYEVEIIEKEICGCGNETNLNLRISDEFFWAYAQVDDEFAAKLPVKESILIDLRLGFCFPEITDIESKKFISFNRSVIVEGCIKDVIDDDIALVDCGKIIEVDSENTVFTENSIGYWLKAKGELRAYFPNTNYEY